MDIPSKLQKLHLLEKRYDEFIQLKDVACKLNCADCCTGNVIVTSIEAYRISEYLRKKQTDHFYSTIENRLSPKRFIPQNTTNQLPMIYGEGKDIPEQDTHPDSGICALLENLQCPIYPVRPFHCRCMMSKFPCKNTGYAQIDPFMITINTVFLQLIEHIDQKGFSGNLSDMLLFFRDPQAKQAYTQNNMDISNTSFISNHPIRLLMIPPEHRNQMIPMVRQLVPEILGTY